MSTEKELSDGEWLDEFFGTCQECGRRVDEPDADETVGREYGKWTYYVTLDGDYAKECYTREEAEETRLHARGHIKVEDRRIWRDCTIEENIYTPTKETS